MSAPRPLLRHAPPARLPMSEQPRVTAEVAPSGRWSWSVDVYVRPAGFALGLTSWSGIVFGSRERADRIARRRMRREIERQRRRATETHTLEP